MKQMQLPCPPCFSSRTLLNQGQTADPEEARPLAGQNQSVSLSGSYEMKDTEIEQIKDRKDRDSAFNHPTYWNP